MEAARVKLGRTKRPSTGTKSSTLAPLFALGLDYSSTVHQDNDAVLSPCHTGRRLFSTFPRYGRETTPACCGSDVFGKFRPALLHGHSGRCSSQEALSASGASHEQNNGSVRRAAYVNQRMFDVLEPSKFAGPATAGQLASGMRRDAGGFRENGDFLHPRLKISRVAGRVT
jgi:hypothetical protein